MTERMSDVDLGEIEYAIRNIKGKISPDNYEMILDLIVEVKRTREAENLLQEKLSILEK